MSQIEVVAYYDRPRGGYLRVVVTGESHERFVDALYRALQNRPTTAEDTLYLRPWRDDEAERDIHQSGYPNYVVVQGKTTLSAIAAFVDDEPCVVTHGGWGGDAWFEPLLDIAEAIGLSITMKGAWSFARKSDSYVSTVRYRRHRTLAADWRDDGKPVPVPSMELIQMVKSRREWHRGQFDTVFGLDDASGTELLRALEYRKEQSAPYALWREMESV